MRFALIMTFISFWFTSFGQVEPGLYNMRPICKKEPALKKYLQTKGIEDSIVYFFHVRPNACPRCEGLIQVISRQLKNDKHRSVCILDLEHENSATFFFQNISKDNFHVIIADTNKSFRTFIDYRESNLNVPFLYKINVKTGQFYSCHSLLGFDFNNDSYNDLKDDTTVESCVVDSKFSKQTNIEGPNSIWETKVVLDESNQPIEDPQNFHINNQYIHFIDYSTETVHVYDLHTGKNVSSIMPVDSEYYYFSTENQRAFVDDLRKDGIARVIYLNSNIVNPNILEISASFPRIEATIKSQDTSIHYYNVATLLTKSFDNKIVRIDSFNTPLEEKPAFSIDHDFYKRFSNNNFYALTLKKGWPAIGTTDSPIDSISNPFLPDFYNDVPVIRIFDKTHKFIGEFGKLSKIYEEKYLGYYYRYINIHSNKKYLYIVDNTSGELQALSLNDVYSGHNNFQRVQLIEKKDKYMPEINIDSFNKKKTYLKAYQKYLFSSYILDIYANDNKFYVAYIDKTKSELVVKKYSDDLKKLYETKTFNLQNINSLRHALFLEQDRMMYLIGIEHENKQYMVSKLALNI